MIAIRLRHIHRFRDRQGRERVYYRPPGGRAVPLPLPVGGAEFMRAYNAAIAAAQPQARAAAGAEGSLDALALSFYGSREWAALRATTQRAYRRIIEALRAKHGAKPVRLLNAAGIRRLRDEAAAGGVTAGNHRLRLLRLLCRHGVRVGLLPSDPTREVERLTYRTTGYRPWADADIAAYQAQWPSGTRQRLALELLLCTGQRRSDVVRMGRQHLRDGAILVRQVKTGAEVAVPILPALAAELAHVPPGQMVFLATEPGPAFTAAGFYQRFREWCAAAGLPVGLSPHGLRKAAGRRLAEAGCTAHEIMAVLGHRTLAEAQRYTADAERVALARQAMGRVEAMASRKSSQTAKKAK